MSYPVTIPAPYTGYGFGNAEWGSQLGFEYLSAQYAFISQDGGGGLGVGDLKPHCMKSVDLGVTWTELDAANAPTISAVSGTGGTQYTVWRDGSTVYLLSLNRPSSGVISGFDVWTFNLTTGLWSGSATTYVAPVIAEDTGVSADIAMIVRGANDYIFIYSGPKETVGGFPRSRAYYATFDGVTFGTGTVWPGQAGNADNYTPLYGCVDSAGRTYLARAGGSSGFGSDIYVTELSALNVFGTPQLATGDYAETGNFSPQDCSQLILIPGSPERIAFVCDTYESGAFDVAMRMFYADVGVAPAFSSSVIIPSDATALEIFSDNNFLFNQSCTLTVDSGGTITCFWITPDAGLSHSTNVYETHADAATLTWSTPVLYLAPPAFTGAPSVYAGQVFSYIGPSGLGLISTWSDPSDNILAEFSFIPSSTPPVAITCGSPPNGVVGVSYSHNFSTTTSGGTAPYAWAITGGSLPPGLHLNSATGVASGLPISTGTFGFTVRVTDSLSAFAEVDCSIRITSPLCDPFGTKLLHSIRRLNDPDESLAATGYTYIVGNSTTLDAGVETALAQIDKGYSGDPLSLIAFRPEQSPESWMYVYDRLKQSKVRADGSVRAIGVAPPNMSPNADFGIPATVDVNQAQSNSGWTLTPSGTFGSEDRAAGSSPTINLILYNSGTTGWCCINPAITGGFNFGWAANRMKVLLNSGGGNAEVIVVRDVLPAITTTTVAGVSYDTGTTGLCSLVLTGNPAGLARNSLIQITNGSAQTDTIRVLSVVLSPDGSVYSIRCSTTHTFAAGNAVVGLNSWYAYTAQTHAATETITTTAFSVTGLSGAGTQVVSYPAAVNASVAAGRVIDPANDYMSFGLLLVQPQNVVDIQLLVNFDAVPNYSFTNPGNSWIWKVSQAELAALGIQAGGSGSNLNWAQIQIPLSSATKYGSPTLTLANITGVAVQLTVTAGCGWAFDWWYLFGTYGPVIQPNAPSGYFYTSTFRDSTTGAASVPGPITRYSLNPLREAVLVTPATTTAAGVDYDDIYREGGTLTDFVYIGSVVNNNASPNTFFDGLSDLTISGNPGVDLTLLQPWPVLGLPLTGVVNVVGTSVKWVSGSTFPLTMLNNTVILLNGVAFLTRGQPKSTTFLELQADAGVLTNAVFSIASPTLAAQTMPLAFGPLEGPFVPVVFALGDPINSGTLYYSNASNLDAAADTNTLELTGPTEPLVTGEVWNGLAFAGSRENVFVVQYSFTGTYQFRRVPGPSGFWSRWTICRGPDGIYALGRDGIYRWTDSGGVSITDDLLYPLFPHGGQPAAGANGLLPVNMAMINFMRLSYTDESIRFTYLDIACNQVTLRYEIARKRWFVHVYADQISYEYLDEALVSSPNTQQIILLSRNLGNLYLVGGNTDNGLDISTTVQLPYLDNGDLRAQKLFIDNLVDADQTGTLQTTALYDNGNTSQTLSDITLAGSRIQTPLDISAVPGGLELYRNISLRFVWTGGPDGPRVFASEPSFYIMPYLSTLVDTQFFNLGFPGWLHMRRLYAGLISTADVAFRIQVQDGRQFNVVIPSTGGQFKVQTLMLPQTIKGLSFAFQLTCSEKFALFPEAFTPETKEWSETSYIKLAVFRA